MTEVGVELQEPELLQAGDISRCPFLQGMMEVLGDQAVQDYLQSLGSAAVAEKRALYETPEAVQEPVESQAERAMAEAATEPAAPTPKLAERASTVESETQTPHMQLLVARTESPRVAKESPDISATVRDHLTKEVSQPEISAVLPEVSMLQSRPERRESAMSLGLLLHLKAVTERGSEAATLFAEEPPQEQESVKASIASRHEAKAVIIPETAETTVAGEVAAKQDDLPLAPEAAASAVTEPLTVEELLAVPEAATDGVPTQGAGGESVAEAIEPEPALPFSEQLEGVIAEVEEPERRAELAVLTAKVYELAELLAPVPVNEVAKASGGEEASSPEQAAELERVVQRLLQALGVAEPTAEQIQRFVGLVRQEMEARAVEPEASYWLDESMHERLQGLTTTISYWLPALAHRLLGRLALLQPASTPVE